MKKVESFLNDEPVHVSLLDQLAEEVGIEPETVRRLIEELLKR